MSSTDYTVECLGLVLGPGTDYTVHSVDAWGIPEYRTSDDPAPLAHGVWTGPEYLEARAVVIEATVRGTSASDLMDNVEALLRAWYLDTTQDGYGTKTPLAVKLPGQDERVLFGRPRRARVGTDRVIGANAPVTLEFFAPDPRWYSATLNTVTINGGSAATGRGYNTPASGRGYDYGYGGGSGNLEIAENAGSFPTLPTVTITGPVTNPYLENSTTGKIINFDITLAVGEQLVVDFANRTVMLGGTASRYYTKRGDWWDLQPGSNSIRLGGTSSSTPTATVEWRDAWI